MRRTEGGSIARFFAFFLGTLLSLAVLAVVGYLLSELNVRRYRLALLPEGLIVERGRFLPLGFERYEPSDPILRQAYAPIAVPAGEAIEVGVVFDERSEVDQALYGRLRAWAGPRLQANDAASLELGIAYVKRLEILPGLSEGQRRDLHQMRADAAYKQAEGLLQGVAQALAQAKRLFEQAIELGTSEPDKARRGLLECHRKASVLQDETTARPPAPALWPDEAGPQPFAAPPPAGPQQNARP